MIVVDYTTESNGEWNNVKVVRYSCLSGDKAIVGQGNPTMDTVYFRLFPGSNRLIHLKFRYLILLSASET